MRTPRTFALVTVATAGLLAGCSSATPSAPTTTAATTTVRAATPSAPAAPSTASGPALGTVHALSASGVTLTVQAAAYTTMSLPADNQEDLPGGTPIGLVAVRVCITANTSTQGVALDWDAWTVLTAAGDSAQALTSADGSDFPSALYDDDPDTAVPTGSCRAGLIPFSLKGLGGPVATVEYSAQTATAEWAVG